jgi:hypothetical protein
MKQIHITAQSIEMVPVDDLIEYPGNARKHPSDQIALLCGMIQEYGFTVPLLIDTEGTIIAGHGRLMAARKLGMFDVPCIRAGHLTRAQIKALVIADNKITSNSSWDEGLLKLEMSAIKEMDEALLGLTGFDFQEIDDILDGMLTEESSDKDDEVPKVHFLSVGKHKIELTPEEKNDLVSLFSEWSGHHGSYRGLIQHLVDAVRNYNGI